MIFQQLYGLMDRKCGILTVNVIEVMGCLRSSVLMEHSNGTFMAGSTGATIYLQQ
jgi:hypothetical protein